MNVRLNKKHQRTLDAIFSKQVPSTLQWRRIEALFMALGAAKEEGSGSSVNFIVEPIITYTPLGEESGIGVPSYKAHEAGRGFSKMYTYFRILL